MNLRKLLWTGNRHSLQIKRHWNAFFDLSCLFEIRSTKMKKMLESGQAFHVQTNYELCKAQLTNFDDFSNWHSFSRLLCDQYCDFFILNNFKPANTYFKDTGKFPSPFEQYHSNEIAVQLLAEKSIGYIRH